jgi:lipoyl-dependent peroxiredoxin
MARQLQRPPEVFERKSLFERGVPPMKIRKARAVWESSLKDGRGTIALGGGKLEVPYDYRARFEDGEGSNPEELIGGAHAGCFSMALAHALTEAGHPPAKIETSARVHLEKVSDGFAIPKIELDTVGEVPGVDEETFQRLAQEAKEQCPVSKVLSAAEIVLTAKLLKA